MGMPVMFYAGRLNTLTLVGKVYVATGFLLGMLGILSFIVAPILAYRQRQNVGPMPLLFLATLSIGIGGTILAVAEDATIFLATLLSSVFALVVSWYERALRANPQGPLLLQRPANERADSDQNAEGEQARQ